MLSCLTWNFNPWPLINWVLFFQKCIPASHFACSKCNICYINLIQIRWLCSQNQSISSRSTDNTPMCFKVFFGLTHWRMLNMANGLYTIFWNAPPWRKIVMSLGVCIEEILGPSYFHSVASFILKLGSGYNLNSKFICVLKVQGATSMWKNILPI